MHLPSKDSSVILFISLRILLEDPRTSVDTVEKKGHTALHLAALRGNFEVMKVLLEMTKVDVNAVDKDGCTALHIAGMKNASCAAAEFVSYK
jgi:ankyrin repeat protein